MKFRDLSKGGGGGCPESQIPFWITTAFEVGRDGGMNAGWGGGGGVRAEGGVMLGVQAYPCPSKFNLF